MNPGSSTRTLQTVVMVLVILGLIALALGGYLTPLSRYALTPLVTAQYWLATRYQTIQDLVTAPKDMAALQKENARLEAEVARLQTEMIELKQQIGETTVLSALLDFARVNPEHEYMAAAVIGRDPSPFMQYVIINRGSDDGLRRGMPVVTDQGLVGRISRVTAQAASVQLITDASSAINVRLEPSRIEAMLVGQVTGEIALDMIAQSAAVQAGDLVLTSGVGGNYPSNVLIGQVSSVRGQDNDLFKTAAVQPSVNFRDLKIVMVITNFHPVDIGPLVPTPNAP